MSYSLEVKGVDPDLLAWAPETVEPIGDGLWAYAIDAPPSQKVQDEVARLFPDWVRDIQSTTPLMESGPTQVGTSGALDPDGVDIAHLLHELRSRGYNAALDAEVSEVVFSVPISRTVVQAVRLAAMYDLYIDLRSQETRASKKPRRAWKMPSPEWIMLGLEGLTVAGAAATEVLRARAQKRKNSSVGELAQFIRDAERRGA